jgi:butyryl-CoA dehydrogenase
VEFELTGEQKRFQTNVREYLKRELEPIVADLGNIGEFPIELFRKFGRDGLLGIIKNQILIKG